MKRLQSVVLLLYLLLHNLDALAYEQYYESSGSMMRGGVEGGRLDQLHSGFNLPHELSSQQQFDLFLKVNGQTSDKTYDLILNPPEAKEGELNQQFSKYFGEKYFINANAAVGINYKGILLVPYYRKVRSSAQLNYKVYPEATGYINDDTGYMFGFGHDFGKLSFGVNYFGFKRNYDVYTVDLISSLNDAYNFKTEESLSSINASVAYELKKNDKRQDVVFISFKNLNRPNQKSKYDEFNTDLIPLINLGYQLRYQKWNIEANVLDLNDYYLGVWQNRIRLGVEYQFSELGLVRSISSGVIDGSLSLGTSINLFRVINLNFSTYQRNLYTYYEKKSRFYNIGFELEF